MVNRNGRVYPCGSNEGFSLKFYVGYLIQHEEGRRTYQPKRCEYNNKDEVNSLNILRDNNYQS